MCHRSNSDYCMTILLRQPWEELVPWEPTPWHWSKHVKFRPSRQFHTGCLSLHSWQTAMLPHVGTLNSAYWAFSYNMHSSKGLSCSIKFFRLKITLGLALGESWLLLAQTQKNTDVYTGLLPCEGFPRQTCNNHLRQSKDLNSSICRQIVGFITVLWRQPWQEQLVPWEPTPWHWSKHVKFRPSGQFHTGCLSLHSWQTAMLPHVGTLNSAYWAFSKSNHSSKGFSCSIKFFRLKIDLGLALGESWLLLAQTQKNTDVYKGKPATITFGENKDVNSSIKFRL